MRLKTFEIVPGCLAEGIGRFAALGGGRHAWRREVHTHYISKPLLLGSSGTQRWGYAAFRGEA